MLLELERLHIRMILKDHVTRKTGVMAAWKLSIAITEINCIWKYIQIEKLF